MSRAVLMFCPQFRPIVGGAERQAERLGKALVAANLNVTVLTPHIDPSSPTLETVDGLPVRRFELSDLTKRFPRFRGLGPFNTFCVGGQIAWQVWRAAREVEVVHCHIGCLQTVAAAVGARLRGVPVICKAAMADNESDLGESAKSGLTGKAVAWIGRYAFTRWVATTQAVREALLRAGVSPERIMVIPNGVELPSGRDGRTPRKVRRFLYLGRLSTNIDRDVPGLLAAFDQLADDVADAELAIVGGGDLLEATRSLAADCRHTDRIQVTGPSDPPQWLSWADVFVLPSRREGLSNALLEAMAAGLPCIANDIPPNREVLADGAAGVLVPVGDQGQLFEALRLMASDATHADSMRTAAVGRARSHYGIEFVATRYAALYEDLIRKALK